MKTSLELVFGYAWLLMPLGLWLLNLSAGKKVHPALLFLLCVLLGFGCLMAQVELMDSRLKTEMDWYQDQIADGRTDPKFVAEADAAADEWASDTGRAFAPIFGGPVTAVCYGMMFCVLWFGEWVVGMFLPTKIKNSESDGSSTENAVPIKEDGNPYRPNG